MDISIAESNNDDNIYISNKENIIEDELITYLKEKYINKKVSLLFNYIYFLYYSNIFLIFFN
jgi:hypothetical protein